MAGRNAALPFQLRGWRRCEWPARPWDSSPRRGHDHVQCRDACARRRAGIRVSVRSAVRLTQERLGEREARVAVPSTSCVPDERVGVGDRPLSSPRAARGRAWPSIVSRATEVIPHDRVDLTARPRSAGRAAWIETHTLWARRVDVEVATADAPMERKLLSRSNGRDAGGRSAGSLPRRQSKSSVRSAARHRWRGLQLRIMSTSTPGRIPDRRSWHMCSGRRARRAGGEPRVIFSVTCWCRAA